MRQADVNGNVLVIFYPVEEKDSSLIGLNYAEGSFLRMLLKDRRMEKGAFIGKANGTMYPMDQIPAEKYKLPTFAWFDYIRPRNKEDIFEWRGKKAGQQMQKSDRKPLTLSLIHILFIKVPLTAPELNKVRRWYKTPTQDAVEHLEKYSCLLYTSRCV